MEKLYVTNNEAKVIDNIRSKDDTRLTLQYLHITKDFIEVTDGRALIRIKKNHALEVGVYEIKAQTKVNKVDCELILEKTDVSYPNTDKVFPNYDKEQLTNIYLNKKDQQSMTKAIIKLFQLTENAYNIELLSALYPLKLTWTAFKVDKDKPIYMESENYKYLLMPFNLG